MSQINNNTYQNSQPNVFGAVDANKQADHSSSDQFHAMSREYDGVQKSVSSLANDMSDFLYPFINPYDTDNLSQYYAPDYDYHTPDFSTTSDHLFTESLLNLMRQGLAGGNLYDQMAQGLIGGNLYDQMAQGKAGGSLYRQMAEGFSGGNLNDQIMQGLRGVNN